LRIHVDKKHASELMSESEYYSIMCIQAEGMAEAMMMGAARMP
jgi:hypothetical protein